ncbi:hypothetical protein CPS_1626 [Colwellia psychrerythraea 34H]|uniref:Uncharacterized protein n=1 Tax=Colwellia psychrerythraea (strain 34H / ATCC BAA-681) TaxID=167879 RepID=Q485A1_COLP3|nr:hypothetical protein CPS_1626 [Colwellia psychrerythraea 34H]
MNIINRELKLKVAVNFQGLNEMPQQFPPPALIATWLNVIHSKTCRMLS